MNEREEVEVMPMDPDSITPTTPGEWDVRPSVMYPGSLAVYDARGDFLFYMGVTDEEVFGLIRSLRRYLVTKDDQECEGHESLDGAHMGESVLCDGSCKGGKKT